MCIHCELSLSDAEIEQMLQAQINSPSFRTWNTTTINQLMTAATGVGGATARNRALHLLEEFSAWRKTQPVTYTPPTGVEPMYPANHITTQLTWLRAFQPPEDKHQISIAARAFQLDALHAEQTAQDAQMGAAIFAGFVTLVGGFVMYHIRNH